MNTIHEMTTLPRLMYDAIDEVQREPDLIPAFNRSRRFLLTGAASLLETSYLLVRPPAYMVSCTKQLVKSPKICWGNTSPCCTWNI